MNQYGVVCVRVFKCVTMFCRHFCGLGEKMYIVVLLGGKVRFKKKKVNYFSLSGRRFTP